MDAVEEVKSRLNIEDVVGEYVELKRAGRNFKGLSPFSSEKSPSFMVSPEKQIWHDFSSGKGGTMFTFVMEMEGLTFPQALYALLQADTDADGDGYPDALEVYAGTLPGDPASVPTPPVQDLRAAFEQAGGVAQYAPPKKKAK